MIRSLLLSVLAVALAGCWETRSYPDRIVWANDDAELGLVKLTFEERKSSDPLNGTTDKRKFRHRVYTRDVAGGELRPVGPEVPGQDGGQLFYMRSRGYFLVTRLAAGGQLEWRLLRADGTYHALGTAPVAAHENDCSLLDFVPSPDGARIAKISRGSSCNAAQLTVAFLDPDSLEPVAAPTVLPARFWSDWTWTRAGEFVAIASEGAWRVRAGAAPVSVPVPTCTNPKTTSGETSADGRLVSYEDPRIVIGPPNRAAAFGCGAP
jgi:hypothetical protein